MRHNTIPLEQALINKINATQEFTYPKGVRIPDTTPELLHRSYNPSLNYDEVYRDVYGAVKNPDAVLVTVRHFSGQYDVLLYKK